LMGVLTLCPIPGESTTMVVNKMGKLIVISIVLLIYRKREGIYSWLFHESLLNLFSSDMA
jgi:hypothetical protein